MKVNEMVYWTCWYTVCVFFWVSYLMLQAFMAIIVIYSDRAHTLHKNMQFGAIADVYMA